MQLLFWEDCKHQSQQRNYAKGLRSKTQGESWGKQHLGKIPSITSAGKII